MNSGPNSKVSHDAQQTFAIQTGVSAPLARADGSTLLLREVMAYRRGEGRYNFSRLPYDERGIACLEAWESLEKRIDAHLAND
jgi:hypothetical protein